MCKEELIMLMVKSDTFQKEVMESNVPVLVDFFATWCGPCKMFSPIVDEFAEENAGKITVGKVNIDDEPELAAQFRVMSIPTAMLFENGQVKETLVGVQPKARLEAML